MTLSTYWPFVIKKKSVIDLGAMRHRADPERGWYFQICYLLKEFRFLRRRQLGEIR